MSIIGIIAVFIIVLVINLIIFEHRGSTISEGTPIKKSKTEVPALLVVDVQEATTGAVSTSECYTRNSDALIQKINTIIGFCDQNNIHVLYIKSEISNWLINILNDSYEKGSTGAELDKRLSIVSDNIISKDKNDAFCNPLLDTILIKNKVNRLYIVGLDAAHCINSTIEAALNRQYRISVIKDAVISETDSLKNLMFDKFLANNVHLLSTEEFFKEQE